MLSGIAAPHPAQRKVKISMPSHFEDFYQKHYRAENTLSGYEDNFDLAGKEAKHPFIWFFLGSLALIILPLAIILYYYFAPGISAFTQPEERQIASGENVSLTVGNNNFVIPGNYLRFAHLRSGGRVKRLDIYFHWPEMTGFVKEEEFSFTHRGVDSPIVNISISAPEHIWSAQKRLQEIYPVYFNGEPEKASYGLTYRSLKPESGYKDYDLFYAWETKGLYLLHCRKETSSLTPPDCYRDIALPGNILLQYRFRRANLKNWRRIEQDVLGLIAKFRK